MKQKPMDFPHFSFLTEEKKRNYKFVKIRVCTLKELLRQSSETLFTQRFINAHKAELKLIYFEYQVENEYKKWRILKRLDDFVEFKKKLMIRYKGRIVAIPIQQQSQINPLMHDVLLDFFEHFLNALAQLDGIEKERYFRLFIYNQVQHDKKQLKIYYQAYLMKRAGGRHNESYFSKVVNMLSSWETKFFTISSQGIYFTEHQTDYSILQNLIFTSTFSFICGQYATGYQYGILINSSHRALTIYCKNIFDLAPFLYFLHQAKAQSQVCSINRYHSFAKVRTGCYSQFYVDGQDYFSDLCDELLSAKKQIFITGWMISPYFSLKRPDPKEQYRLDAILEKISNAGIKIYIIIYNAPKVALNIESQFTQTYLNGLSQNIKVLMHPNYILIPFLWSHHQKMVIIDQKIAFIGGLDLGYGRYDTQYHVLNDQSSYIWPGVDYCNYRVTDITNPKQFRVSSIDRQATSRMPWHDVGVKLQGGSVKDLCRHFIQYWNHANFQLHMNDRQLLMYAGLDQIEAETPCQLQSDSKNQNDGQNIEQPNKQSQPSLRSYRKAYSENQLINHLVLNLDFLNIKEQDQLEQSKTQSEQTANQSINLANSYNSSLYEIRKSSSHSKDGEMQFYAEYLKDLNKLATISISHKTNKEPANQDLSPFEDVFLRQNESISENYEGNSKIGKSKRQIHQVLRSASMWSLGLQQSETEKSILNAYIQLINNAEEFIYIQNQFFMCQENGVARAIYKKIIWAHQQNKKFKVMIFLPALPGFEGHPQDQKCAVFRIQIHLILKTLKYLKYKLRKIPSINKYLYIFSLRTHGLIKNKPVTQIIYIHSKIMIVDDRVALIGSANINDRSLQGNRDSEIAVVIQDQQKLQLKIGVKLRAVSEFAHNLRKQLIMQHFGIEEQQCVDYHNQTTWAKVITISNNNHKLYREIFGCYPDNEMDDFAKIKKIQGKADINQYDQLHSQIKGHAIPFQQSFLNRQNLQLGPSQAQYFLPFINFT